MQMTGPGLYMAFLALVAGWRLLELWISRRNFIRFGGKGRLLKEAVFPWMVLLHGSFFVVLPLEYAIRLPEFGSFLSWFGLGGTLIAFGLRIWTLRTIGPVWHVRVVTLEDHPIVTNGPYRLIRHPNYLVVIMELMFIPLIYGLYWSSLTFTILNGVVLFFRIRGEEAQLRCHARWREEMAPKPRFIPQIFSRRPLP